MIIYQDNENNIFMTKGDGLSFPLHVHYDIEIFICLSGEIEVICSSSSFTLKKGMAFISYPYQVHSYKNISDCEHIIIRVSPNILPAVKNLLASQSGNIANVGSELIFFSNSLYEEYISEGHFETILGYLYIIISKIIRNLIPDSTYKETFDTTFSKALKYISENYLYDISLKSVSRHVGVSCCHLSRLFTKIFSCTFISYVQNLRIEYAKHLLLNTDNKISYIAISSGFTSLRTFNRTFKNITNQSPKEFRTAGK